MEQRVSLITLGVTDLGRARAFYEALGWQGQAVEDIVFFQAGGLAVALWGRVHLAADCGVEDPGVSGFGVAGFGGIALAHNVRSPAEVDDVLAEAEQAGGTVTRRAARTPWGGYSGVFADPDGHLWEVAHNPGFPMADDGTITVQL
jgi:catechol 2,3-dioxygenase-like lactoylglutathione lyase family enzyme